MNNLKKLMIVVILTVAVGIQSFAQVVGIAKVQFPGEPSIGVSIFYVSDLSDVGGILETIEEDAVRRDDLTAENWKTFGRIQERLVRGDFVGGESGTLSSLRVTIFYIGYWMVVSVENDAQLLMTYFYEGGL